jgi:mannose/fructose/N-acetylgalactosamine-specific phosphotransferase system component IIC
MSVKIPSIAMQSGQVELALNMGWYGIGCDLTCDVTTGGPVSTNFFSVSHQKKKPSDFAIRHPYKINPFMDASYT